MKKVLFVTLSFITLLTHGQDPSFSQFDLNMSHLNPSFSGYEGSTKALLHSRIQWYHMNEKFNNHIFEFSLNVNPFPDRRKSYTTWGPGLGVISEDLGFTNLGNSVFVKKIEVSLYPLTFHQKIDFRIGKIINLKNLYLSYGPSFNIRQYKLSTENLIFTDQWSAFGAFNPVSGAPLSTFVDMKPRFDGGFGITLTKHGKYQMTQGNRISIGSSINHVTTPSESFSSNPSPSSQIPYKNVIHAEWLYGIPAFKKPFIPYVKTVFKHERYSKEIGKAIIPWNESIMSKTEFGGTVFINYTPMEVGVLYRIDHNFEQDYHLQTVIPIIRFRVSRRDLFLFTYSYDWNVASKLDRLTIGETGPTHEFGLSIYISQGKGPKGGCPAFMENSALYKDIYNNGLLNSKKPKHNFNRK